MRARGLVHVSMKLTLIDNSFMVDDELGNRDLLIRSVCFSPRWEIFGDWGGGHEDPGKSVL